MISKTHKHKNQTIVSHIFAQMIVDVCLFSNKDQWNEIRNKWNKMKWNKINEIFAKAKKKLEQAKHNSQIA